MTWLKKNILGIPVFLYMATLVAVPMIYVFALSFLSRDDIGGVVFQFTPENYRRITDPVILGIFRHSFTTAAIVSLCALLIGGPFAYFAARLDKRRGFKVLLFVMFVFWTSSLIRTNGWMIILQTNGVLNRFLMFLDLNDGPGTFMFNTPATIAVTVYMFLPFMILPVYNAVGKIEPSLCEASYDLGAGKVRTFFKITLPLCSAGIAGGIALVFMPVVGLYFISDTIGGGLRMTLGNLIHNQMAGHGNNHPFGAALSVVLLAVLGVFMALYLLLSRYTGRGGMSEP